MWGSKTFLCIRETGNTIKMVLGMQVLRSPRPFVGKGSTKTYRPRPSLKGNVHHFLGDRVRHMRVSSPFNLRSLCLHLLPHRLANYVLLQVCIAVVLNLNWSYCCLMPLTKALQDTLVTLMGKCTLTILAYCGHRTRRRQISKKKLFLRFSRPCAQKEC